MNRILGIIPIIMLISISLSTRVCYEVSILNPNITLTNLMNNIKGTVTKSGYYLYYYNNTYYVCAECVYPIELNATNDTIKCLTEKYPEINQSIYKNETVDLGFLKITPMGSIYRVESWEEIPDCGIVYNESCINVTQLSLDINSSVKVGRRVYIPFPSIEPPSKVGEKNPVFIRVLAPNKSNNNIGNVAIVHEEKLGIIDKIKLMFSKIIEKIKSVFK